MDTSTLAGIIFLVVGALVLLSELHTLTIYLLAVAAGLFAAGGLALAGGGLTADFALLAIIIILGLPIAHWWRRKLKNRASEDISQDDIGNKITVVAINGPHLRVDYRGSTWDARLADDAIAMPSVGATCTIARRDGNTLFITP
ncbi:MAG TPA: NfeD family protein [Rhodanobacteraceae bacterium]